jgi:lipopolysaccharide export system protein LptA
MTARFAVLLLALASAPAWPLAADRQKPIEIQADRVVIDEKQHVSTYEGNVELTQGSLRVNAARVEVRRGEEVDRVIATGEPVTFRQQTDEGREVRGQSRQVDYAAASSTVELTGDAHLWQGNDEFAGPKITYDTQRSLVRAEAQEGGRVSATIHPKPKTESRK